MRLIMLGLALILTVSGSASRQRLSRDSELADRAAELCQALEAERYDRLWEMSSPSLHDANGDDVESLVERLRALQPEGSQTKVVSARSYKAFGVVRTRTTVLSDSDGHWSIKTYESTWTLEDGVWLLDQLDPVAIQAK